MSKLSSWVGFKGEATADQQASTPNALDRIRELESQLADLRSRRDITSLTREEFEILATETAMNLVKTAQLRESRASAQSEKLISESDQSAKATIEAADSKAKSLLASAESRGRKYIEAAEGDAAEAKKSAERAAAALTSAATREAESIREEASSEAESIIAAKRREAGAISAAAKREAERLIEEATASISDYRSWLGSAIAESERLYRIQTQSLAAATTAIEQSRQRLGSAFDRLAGLGADIEANLDEGNRPTAKNFVRNAVKNLPSDEVSELSIPEVRVDRVKKVSKKRQAKRSATKKVVKKSPAKKAVAKKAAKRAARKPTKSTGPNKRK